jgi:hypothetical protein
VRPILFSIGDFRFSIPHHSTYPDTAFIVHSSSLTLGAR